MDPLLRLSMKTSLRILCLAFLFFFAAGHAQGQQSGNAYSTSIMKGISNNGQHKDKPYVTAGDRTYVIGTQDGNFPDMGNHVKGEMGGLWLHPIKLIDGFWVKLTDLDTHQAKKLSEAVEFINYPYGNRFKYAPVLDGVDVERFQFCPDGQEGMVVQYSVKNTSNRKRKLNFEFSVKTDLSPVWYSNEIGIQDSTDHVDWEAESNFFSAKDDGNPWFGIWGGTQSSSARSIGESAIAEQTIGNGVAVASEYTLPVDRQSAVTLTFIIAGSSKSKNDAVNTYKYLIKNYDILLEKKKNHYAAVIERARISIPDQRLQEVFNWVKVDNEWLVRDVPGIGRGLGAGLMEYPWWFSDDNSYALQAVMATGDFDLAKQTLRLLNNQSMKKNGNGRIVHEISTNGAMPNPGNTQETAQFILCAEKLFQWTGDMEFIREMYPEMKMGIRWLLTDMDQNQNLFPEGYGIMEVHGLNAELIDVAVYTQQALEATARVAGVLNEPQVQNEYRRIASELAAKINENFWDESEGSYCDFYGNKEQAIRAAEGNITQLRLNADEEMIQKRQPLITYYEQLKNHFLKLPEISKGWITNKNWVIATPMETGIAPRERAIRLLDKIRKENVGEYGPYLAAVEKNAMMTISTGVLAVSEANYGRIDESLWYVDKIVQTFNRVLPGSISEMMPDYGCFTQAWTSYGIVVPLVRNVFGIQPDALNKRIVFEPQLPSGWENMSIENLPVSSNTISFSRAKSGKGIQYTLTGAEAGWNLILKLKDSPGAKYYLNGSEVPFDPSGIRMTEKINQILVVH